MRAVPRQRDQVHGSVQCCAVHVDAEGRLAKDRRGAEDLTRQRTVKKGLGGTTHALEGHVVESQSLSNRLEPVCGRNVGACKPQRLMDCGAHGSRTLRLVDLLKGTYLGNVRGVVAIWAVNVGLEARVRDPYRSRMQLVRLFGINDVVVCRRRLDTVNARRRPSDVLEDGSATGGRTFHPDRRAAQPRVERRGAVLIVDIVAALRGARVL